MTSGLALKDFSAMLKGIVLQVHVPFELTVALILISINQHALWFPYVSNKACESECNTVDALMPLLGNMPAAKFRWQVQV